jgi:hypothetical protein
MDDTRFDELTRRLLNAVDRRGLLRVVPAALTTLATVAVPPVSATKKKRKKKKKNKRRCQQDDVRCDGTCVRGVCCPGQSCGSRPSCVCRRTIEGDTFCAFGPCLLICLPCSSSSECVEAARCAENGIDNEGDSTYTCLDPCDLPPPT